MCCALWIYVAFDWSNITHWSSNGVIVFIFCAQCVISSCVEIGSARFQPDCTFLYELGGEVILVIRSKRHLARQLTPFKTLQYSIDFSLVISLGCNGNKRWRPSHASHDRKRTQCILKRCHLYMGLRKICSQLLVTIDWKVKGAGHPPPRTPLRTNQNSKQLKTNPWELRTCDYFTI